ncbi:hypothetical protein IAT38_003653 [Cryptococcus sp. DSM 104549]
MVAPAPYQLSYQLDPPHQSDCKAVLAIGNDLLATASRDSSVAVWKRSKDGREFHLASLLSGHGAYVNSLAHIPSPDRKTPDHLASGGNSSVILLHDLSTLDTTSKACLIGHSLNVCSLSFSSKRRKILSGSWDLTARVWGYEDGEWKSELVLDGHEAAVWDAVAVDEGPKAGCFLTSDRLIYLWDDAGKLIIRFKGSPEPVRSLAILPGGETFASACNDGLVRIWDFEGHVVQTLRGHTDYVYHVAVGNSKRQLLSCGEDHTIRIWDDDEDPDTLLHPCQTVWSASFFPNGDVVSGGSDGGVRIWSQAEDRIAEPAVRESYMAEVDAAMPKPQPKAHTAVEATAGPGERGATLVIDIDLSDDAPPIPLVYRLDSDPRTAAEEFGKEHSLSENYVKQIEAFIRAHLA